MGGAGNGVAIRFGARPDLPSIGRCILGVVLPAESTNKPKSVMVKLNRQISDSNVPLLIARQSLAQMKASLDFRK